MKFAQIFTNRDGCMHGGPHQPDEGEENTISFHFIPFDISKEVIREGAKRNEG